MNKTKLFWHRTLKILLLALPVFLFATFLPINEGTDTRRIREYYMEEPGSLDVVFLGASDVYAGYSPVLAYEEYGFTSYPYVLSGNHIQLVPAQLVEVHRTQSPKLLVIEITELLKVDEIYEPRMYQFLAGIPFSQNKVDVIRQYGVPGHRLSYFFPFMVNHGSLDWNDLELNYRSAKCVRERGYSILKGAITFTGSGENWDGPYVEPIDTDGDISTAEIPEDLRAQFVSLLNFCRKQGYDNILFVNFPHRIVSEDRYLSYQLTNSLGSLIESYGYDFLNVEQNLHAVGIVPKTDFYNNDHMNLYGQYKVTRYLCDYIQKEYGIGQSQLSAECRKQWDNCVEYQHLFYQMFDHYFKTRKPEEFGIWMEEDVNTINRLDEIREKGLPTQ